ncbi:hypothetical protein FHX35_001781 [Auritidibacter ignavus]|nr:hypothetical protein [Auritidibacter ignavus]
MTYDVFLTDDPGKAVMLVTRQPSSLESIAQGTQ